MAGLLFVICLPTAKYEASLRRLPSTRSGSDKSPNINQSRSSESHPLSRSSELKPTTSDTEKPASRSKSADCVRSNGHNRGNALFIGPWCVGPRDSSDRSTSDVESNECGIQIHLDPTQDSQCAAGSQPSGTISPVPTLSVTLDESCPPWPPCPRYSASTGPSTVTSASTGPGTVTSASTGPGTVTSASTGPGTVSSASTGPSTVTSASTGPGTVTSASTGPGTVTSASTGPGTVTSASTGPGTVSSASTGPSTVTSASTGPGTVTSASTGPGTVTSASTGPCTVSSASTGPGTVSSASTGPGTVTSASTGPGTVTSASTGPGTVTSGSTGPSSVTSASTGSSTVTSGSTGPSSVNSASTGPSSVNSASTGPSTVTSASTGQEPGAPSVISTGQTEAPPEGTMEKELIEVLDELGVRNAAWCVGKSEKFYRVTFSMYSGKASEEALRRINDCGIGSRLNSALSVIPCALYFESESKESSEYSEEAEDTLNLNRKGLSTCGNDHCGVRDSCSAWESFVRSMRARITVAQVVEGVRANAAFTFDFVILLVVASIVAALGLLENSTLILAASMLISPLMGPVMAATFGTMLRDTHLRRMGVVNELSGLLMCMLLGFMTGLVVSYVDRPWPLEDMVESQCVVSLLCRGRLRSMWVNVAIAILSGAAISISLMRGHTGSLVGVAISASLMPPAVNAGLLWAMSVVHWSFGGNAYTANGDDPSEMTPEFIFQYFDSLPAEFAVMGAVSLCLTVVNIVFIYLIGIIMLKIKEVSPVTSRGSGQQFWRHDVKIARDYNRTLNEANGERTREQLTSELMNGLHRRSKLCGNATEGLDVPNLESILGRSFEREGPIHRKFPYLLRNEATWSPSMTSIYVDLKKLCRIARRSTDYTDPHEPADDLEKTNLGSRHSFRASTRSTVNVVIPNGYSCRKINTCPRMRKMDGMPAYETLQHSISSSSFRTCCEINSSRNESHKNGGMGCETTKITRFTVTSATDMYSLHREPSTCSLTVDPSLDFAPTASGSPYQF